MLAATILLRIAPFLVLVLILSSCSHSLAFYSLTVLSSNPNSILQYMITSLFFYTFPDYAIGIKFKERRQKQ